MYSKTEGRFFWLYNVFFMPQHILNRNDNHCYKLLPSLHKIIICVNSTAFLLQRLSIAVQRGNAASVAEDYRQH